MGSIAAHKVRTVITNVSWVIAAEMLAASRGMEFISHKVGQGAEVAHHLIRERVPFKDADDILYQQLNQVYDLLLSGRVNREAEKAIEKR